MRQQVVKLREVYLYENVRIHLDRVDGLGTFVELEAVQDGTYDAEQQRALLDTLRQRLHIGNGDLLAESYADLMAESLAARS